MSDAPGHRWQVGRGAAPYRELTKDTAAPQKAISASGKPVCLVHLTLPGCPTSRGRQWSIDGGDGVNRGGDDACKPECVRVSQCSQCRSGQGRLLTSLEESSVRLGACGGRRPRIFHSGGSSSSLESPLELPGSPHWRSPGRAGLDE
jgi:hypothetical protein